MSADEAQFQPTGNPITTQSLELVADPGLKGNALQKGIACRYGPSIPGLLLVIVGAPARRVMAICGVVS
jgi:hypothetical protein